ncbi:glycosyltransferase [Daejeonella sp.]|uniref:glycosyltransferase family 4 protein n=1 Tax=Daejeonella sp. TaxID=2805397 RepID=UPI0030BCB6B0
MREKLKIYIVGDFKSGAADGLAEFNYQNVQLLRDIFLFEFIEFDTAHGTHYHNIEIREGISVNRFGRKEGITFQLPSAFQKWLFKIQPGGKIFHLNHIWNVANYLIAKRLVKAQIPYMITPHDSYVYGPAYNDNKPFLKRLYRQAFVRIFDKYVLDHAKIVHAITTHCISSLRLITRTKIVVVENQIRDIELTVSDHQVKARVCFIGRFNIFQKGIDQALEAFSIFQRQSGTVGDQFVLIGPADNTSLLKVSAICGSLGLALGTDVILTGKIPENERNSILRNSKAYLQLSRYEGFGLSVGQALSCYKPVVVSASIPISDVINTYSAGFVVNNAPEAAEALNKIFSLSEQEYLEISANARRCYEERFNPKVIKPKLTSLYRSIA